MAAGHSAPDAEGQVAMQAAGQAGLGRAASQPLAPDTPPFLRLAGVRKRFGAFNALEAIDLEFSPGEFVCFLGPSGCGKTTLLRVIAGLERQDSGQVFIDGQDVSTAPVAQRGVGLVFQSYALFPNLTARQNIAYGLSGRAAQKRAQAESLLERMGLAGEGHKYPAQLSGGQQQRVALARALAPNPRLLLLDEPLSALDALVRLRLRTHIRALHRQLGITTIMVTHDREEALSMADRIVLMRAGRIVQIGTPEQLYTHPCDPFAAEFVGRVAFLPARMGEGDTLLLGKQSLVLAAEQMPRQPAPPGTPVWLALRPEAVRLALPGEAGDLSAQLGGREFLGAHTRLSLDLPGLEAPLPNGDFVPLLADLPVEAAAKLQDGQSLRVTLDRAAARVFARKAHP